MAVYHMYHIGSFVYARETETASELALSHQCIRISPLTPFENCYLLQHRVHHLRPRPVSHPVRNFLYYARKRYVEEA